MRQVTTFIFAIGIVAGGWWLSQSGYVEVAFRFLEIPVQSWMSDLPLWLSIAAGGLLILWPTPKIILRIGGQGWTRQQLSRHFLIVGDTGAGKTEGGMQRVMVELLKNVPNMTGLLISDKGDEHVFMTDALKHRGRPHDAKVLAVRPDNAPPNWVPEHRYNLISDRSLPWTTHAKAVADAASALTEGQQSSFFKPSAIEAMAFGMRLLDALKKPVTLSAVRDIFRSREAMKNLVEGLSDVMVDATGRNEEHEQILNYFNKEFLTAKSADQSAGIEGTVGVFLAPFQHPDIAEVFCSDKTNTLNFSELDKSTVIMTSIPVRFQSERQFVHTMLKTMWCFHGYKRNEMPRKTRESLPLSPLFCDEIQNVITAAEDGMSDVRAAGVLRSAGMPYIGATQSELSFELRLRSQQRKILMKQFRSRVYFRVPDEEDGKLAAAFIGTRSIMKRSRTTSGVIGREQRTLQEMDEYRVKPTVFSNLKDFQAIIIHAARGRFWRPSYRKTTLTPITAQGTTPDWYGIRGLLKK